MKKIIMLVMAAVMALTAFGCSNSDNQSSSSLQTGTVAKDNSEVGASKADSPSKADDNSSADNDNSNGIKPGNYIQNDKLKFTFEKAKQYDEIKTSDFYTATPDEGKKYLVLFFEAENVSNKNQYVNYLYFKAYTDNYETDMKALLGDVEGYKWFTGALDTGKKMKGYLAYEVDPSWKNFELKYKEIGDKESIDFSVTPQDLAQ